MSILLILNLAAGAVLFGHSLCALNRMNRHSNHLHRAFHVLVGVGAVAVLTGPLYGYTSPQLGEALLNIGVAGVAAVGCLIKNRRSTP